MQKGHHAISGLRELVAQSIHTYCAFLSEMKMVYSRNGYQDSMSGLTWRDLLRRVSLVPLLFLPCKQWWRQNIICKQLLFNLIIAPHVFIAYKSLQVYLFIHDAAANLCFSLPPSEAEAK